MTTKQLVASAIIVTCSCSSGGGKDLRDGRAGDGGEGDVGIDGSDVGLDADGHQDADVAHVSPDADVDGDRGTTDADPVEPLPLVELVWESGGVLMGGWDMVAADFDADDAVDVLVSSPSRNTVHVFQGMGDGSFDYRGDLRINISHPLGMAAADFDGDDTLDLAVATGGDGDGAVNVLAGVGDLTFAAPVSLPVAGTPVDVGAGDVSCDGVPDLLVLAPDGAALFEHLGAASALPSSVGFSVAQVLPSPSAFVVGFIDEDPCADVVAVDRESSELAVLFGHATVESPALEPGPASPFSVHEGPGRAIIADVTRDGQPDLLVTRPEEGVVNVLERQGDSAYEVVDVAMVHASMPSAMTVGDVDSDGWPDVLVGTCGTECGGPGGTDVFVLSGGPSGLEPARGLRAQPGLDRRYAFVDLIDLDGDSASELVVLAVGRQISVEVYRLLL